MKNKEEKFDVLVVGAGLSGVVIAERYANVLNKKVLIIDKREHIAGNCYDYIDNNIIVSKYGAHIFHTSDDEVWQYVNKFTEFNDYKHEVRSFVNSILVPFPINIDTINKLFNEVIITGKDMRKWILNEPGVDNNGNVKNSHDVIVNSVGKRLYKLLFESYTIKQWDLRAKDLVPEVAMRIPIRFSNNTYYFSDKYEGIPKNGYTAMVKKMLSSNNIVIRLGVDYLKEKKLYAHIKKKYYTGPTDAYFCGIYGKLGYRSLIFKNKIIRKRGFYQSKSVINYPEKKIAYTRIIEYKYFHPNNIQDKTIISKEYSVGVGEPFYPIPNKKNILIFRKYQRLIEKEEKCGVIFIGRLANYKYFDMDQAIKNSLDVFNREENEKRDR